MILGLPDGHCKKREAGKLGSLPASALSPPSQLLLRSYSLAGLPAWAAAIACRTCSSVGG